MVQFSGADPRNGTLKTGTTVSGPGLLLTNDSTNNTLDLTAANEIAIGVSAGDSTRDVDGVLQTAAGAKVSFFPLGGVLMVQSEASQTYTTGLLVYAQADGLVGTTSSSRKLLGIYVGEGETTGSSAGDMIPVMTAGAATA